MENKQISVLIPVYRESELLLDLLEKLVSQKIEKEIFVVVDEPTSKMKKVSKKFGKEVKFIFNKKRIGKANSLNKVAKYCSGRVLLFLDSDVNIPDDKDFLKKIVEDLEDAELLDIKKEVIKESFLSKMTYYEYVGFNIGSYLAFKFLKKYPAVNGSAFAIKRELFNSLKGFRRVVCEDLDVATRCFSKNCKYKYTKRIKVHNKVHSDWKNWLVQRKRWAIGEGLWFREHYKLLIKEGIKKPQIFIPALFFVFPALILLLVNLLIPDIIIYKLFSFLFLFLAIKFNFVLPILLFTTLGINISKGLFFSLLSFLSFSALFFIFSKKLDFEFKLSEFFVYYFFYSLLTIYITMVGLLNVFVLNKVEILDWKI